MSRPTVEQALDSLDPETQKVAGPALDRLLPDGGTWEDFTQLELQAFLWYQLPTKWLTDTRHQHEVAWALADLFACGGLDRYAALCRAEATHRLIALWAEDLDAAHRMLRELMADSGVDPPDTDLLSWGELQQAAEAEAAWATARELERAIGEGRLVPGPRGWQRRARDIARAVLLAAPEDGDPRSRLERIGAERAEAWVTRTRQRGLPVPEDLAALLTRPAASDLAAVAKTLEPLRWLLRQVGDGITLTERGYLPRALALEADATFGWFDLAPQLSVRGERDLPELMFLHELARAQRLVSLKRRRLTLTARGRALLDEGESLARTVLEGLFPADAWEGDVGIAVATALLATGPGDTLSWEALEATLWRYLASSWRRGSDPLQSEDLGGTAWSFLRPAAVFGWVTEDLSAWEEVPVLTPEGRIACLTGLRLVAPAPTRR